MKNLRDRTGGAPSETARRALAALAVLLALTSGAGRATAADVRPFQLTDLSGFVELGFLTQLQQRGRSLSQNSAFNRVEFSQLLNASGRAYVYHPNFLTLQGGLQLEFIEDVLEQVDHRILPAGDLRLDFLRNYRNSLSIFGRVLATEQVRTFSTRYDALSQLYGATFYQRWGWIPFDLTFQHRSIESSGPGSFDEAAEEILFRGSYELGEQSRGSIDYDLIFRDRAGTDVRRQDLIVDNLSYFGDEREKALVTNLLLSEEITELASDKRKRYSVSGNTNFHWYHSDDLSTAYFLSGRWTDFGNQSVTTLEPRFSIRHELYESLTSQGEVFGRLRDGSIGSWKEFGAWIREGYAKRLGGWGRLNIYVSPQMSKIYNRPEADSVDVVDENHVMRLDQPVTLRQTGVVQETIVVTNVTGSIEYEEGLDYIVISLGEGFETQLELESTGAIVDGQTVLVSYTFEPVGRSDILDTSLNVHASLWILEHLLLFGGYELNDQKLVSGDERSSRTNPYDRAVVGLELRWPWLSARAEFEDYDAAFSPFRGYLARVSLSSNSTKWWLARCLVGYSFRDYWDADDTLSRLGITAAASKRLFRRGELDLEARYRRVRWTGEESAGRNVEEVYLNAGFSWWRGPINVKLEGGVAQIFRKAEKKREYRVDLRVRRSF
jgi:hypothetical protein